MGIKHSRPVPPFMRYCSAIIPTMFDDSLSYYEALCALNRFIQKNLVEVINNNATVTQEYIELTIQLKDYVENYFENLDVQEEINNKLDEMAEDGELERILATYVQPQIDQQNAEIRQFEGNVNTQLNHFSEELAKFNISPKAVSSLADMTNHNTIYVYTVTGEWYYWDNATSQFVVGGDYQPAVADNLSGSSIADNSIAPSKTTFYSGYNLRTDYVGTSGIFVWDNAGTHIDPDTSKYTTGAPSTHKCVKTPIPFNSFIKVSRSATTDRFRVGVSVDRPVNGTTMTVLFNDATADDFTFYNGSTNSWLVVQYTNSGQTANINVEIDNRNEIRDCIRVNSLGDMEYVESENIFDPNLYVYNVGPANSANYYRYREAPGYKSYTFAMTPDTTYTINTSGYDKFRIVTYRSQPMPTGYNETLNNQSIIYSMPSRVIADDDTLSTYTFNSGGDLYCSILLSTVIDTEGTLEIIPADSKRYRIAKQYVSDYLINKEQGGYVFNDDADASNRFWSMWANRLRFGMNYTTAPVPAYFNSQVFVDGTLITHNTGSQDNNRWGLHLFEGYSSDNYGRVTLLTDKFTENGKKTGAFYYINGGNEYATSYANMKIGSDVVRHSFNFERDNLTAYGAIDCKMPVTLARINPSTDLDDTYETVAEADAAHHPEGQATANIKCLKYIYLHNAEDGCMWYDTARNKVVIKINGAWHDLNTTEVPEGTYDF